MSLSDIEKAGATRLQEVMKPCLALTPEKMDEVVSILSEFPRLATRKIIRVSTFYPVFPLVALVRRGGDLEHVKTVYEMQTSVLDVHYKWHILTQLVDGKYTDLEVLSFLTRAHPKLKTRLTPCRVDHIMFILLGREQPNTTAENLAGELLVSYPNCCSWDTLKRSLTVGSLSKSSQAKIEGNMSTTIVLDDDESAPWSSQEKYQKAFRQLLPQTKDLDVDFPSHPQRTAKSVEVMKLIATEGTNLESAKLTLSETSIKSNPTRQLVLDLLGKEHLDQFTLILKNSAHQSDDDLDVFLDIQKCVCQRKNLLSSMKIGGVTVRDSDLVALLVSPNGPKRLDLGSWRLVGSNFDVPNSTTATSLREFLFTPPSIIDPSFLQPMVRFLTKISTLERLFMPLQSFNDTPESAGLIIDLVHQNRQLEKLLIADFPEDSIGYLWEVLGSGNHRLKSLTLLLVSATATSDVDSTEDIGNEILDVDDSDDSTHEEEDDGEGEEAGDNDGAIAIELDRVEEAGNSAANDDSSQESSNKNGPVYFEQKLLEILQSSNTSLTHCDFVHDSDRFDSHRYKNWVKSSDRLELCHEIHYYLHLNAWGRQEARAPSNKMKFVELLSRHTDRNSSDYKNISTEEDKVGVTDHPIYRGYEVGWELEGSDFLLLEKCCLYGLLREKPDYWSNINNAADEVMEGVLQHRPSKRLKK